MTAPADFTALPDLASRRLGGSVVFATDELFAEKENLVKPEPPVFAPAAFGLRGKVYDGWETRRHRAPEHDHAIVRLGVPGLVHGVVVDTSFFRGNYPPQVSVEAVGAEGYPSPAELTAMTWQTLVPRSDARGDAANVYPVAAPDTRFTHVRLSVYPDGGVARFRVHGIPLPDPRFLDGTVDLAALENGGRVTGCSDAFYASAGQLILPGRAAGMAEGWENARRRGPGHDYVIVALAAAGKLRHAEIDTSWFIGNAPDRVRLLALDERGGHGGRGGRGGRDPGFADPGWREVLPLTRVQPDTRHRFRLDGGVASHVRLDVVPDGGLARLRIHGEIIPEALAGLRRRWQDALPPGQRPATADGDR
ncbi:MAG TPA: allantoicase [Streptosporangiaceae bacterium]|nr:allantoicase [Streptosporangiaceae bacterium]